MSATCPTCQQPVPPPHGITIDANAVYFNGKSVRCTRRQILLFTLLLRRIGMVLTHETLWEHLYGDDPNGGAEKNTMKVLMFQLRGRLNTIGLRVVTIWGVGVKLERPGAAPDPGHHMKHPFSKNVDVLTATVVK